MRELQKMRELKNILFVIALSLCVVALEGCGGSSGGGGGGTTNTPSGGSGGGTTPPIAPIENPTTVPGFWAAVNEGGLPIQKGDYAGTDEEFIESFKTKEYKETGGAAFEALGLRHFYARGVTGEGMKIAIYDAGFVKEHIIALPQDTLIERLFWLDVDIPEDISSRVPIKTLANTGMGTHASYAAILLAAGKDDIKQHGIAYGAEVHHFRIVAKLDPRKISETLSQDGQDKIAAYEASNPEITSIFNLRGTPSIYRILSRADRTKITKYSNDYNKNLRRFKAAHNNGIKMFHMSYTATPQPKTPDAPTGDASFLGLMKIYQKNMALPIDHEDRFDMVLSLVSGNDGRPELNSPSNLAHWLEVKDKKTGKSLGGYAITSTSVASTELGHLLPGGTFDPNKIISNMREVGYSGDFPNKCGTGKSSKFCLGVIDTIVTNPDSDLSPVIWGWKPDTAMTKKCEKARAENPFKAVNICFDGVIPRGQKTPFSIEVINEMLKRATTNRLLMGTSGSNVIITGVITLLRQAFPKLKAYEIVKLLLESAHKATEKEEHLYGQGILSPWRALLIHFEEVVVWTEASSYEATGVSLSAGGVRVAPSLGALPLLKPLKGNTPLQILFFDKFRDPNRYWVQDINDTFLSSVSRGEEKPVLSFFSSVSSTLKAEVGKGRLLLNKEEGKMAYEGVLGEVPYRVGIGGEVLEEEDRVLALASHGDLLEEKRSFSLGSGFYLGFAQGEKEGYRVYSGYRKTFGSGFLYTEAGIVREGEAFLGGRGTAFMEFANGGRTWYGRIQGRIRAGGFEMNVAAYMGRSFSGGEGSQGSWLRLKEGRSQSGGISVKKSLSGKRSIELGALFPLKSSYVGEMSQLEVLKGDLLGTLRWSQHDVRLSSEGREKLFYGSYTQVVKTGGKIHLSFGVRLQRNHVPNSLPESFYLLQYRRAF